MARLPSPPPSRRDELVEVLHGIEVPDPFRWLEAGEDPEVRAWVAAQNDRTEAVLGSLPGRAELHAELSGLLRASTSSSCRVAGARVFSLERGGHRDQAVLVVRSADEAGPAQVVVDPRARTGDPTAAVDWYEPSPDGALVAYGLSTGGDERSTLHVHDVVADRDRGEAIPHTRAASVAWRPDASGFAYTRYPAPGQVPDDELGYWRKAWWHDLGAPWEDDALAWGDLPDRTAWPDVSLSPDGRWLLVHVSLGWSRVDVHLVEVATGERTTVIHGAEATTQLTFAPGPEAGSIGRLVGVTTLAADRGRVVAVALDDPRPERWETLVPEGERVVEAVAPTADALLVLSTWRAVSQLHVHDPDGTARATVPLPGLGSLAGLATDPDRTDAFVSFTSFTVPPTLLRWEPDRGTTEWSPSGAGDPHGAGRRPDPGGYVVEQVRYPSIDGTEVSMFLVRAAGTTPGPDTPCVLTGYGGFAVTMGPAYSPAVVAVCDRGGLYAVANLRGGSEEGEAWHRAGMRERKQSSFDDFIAAADWLVATGRTSPARLAIRGGSNGGLLMGAALTQRPDLCRAAQVAVPLLDMVRFHRFLIARLWIPEYGDPDHPDELRWLWAYSPYHRVVDGTCYPAVLLTAGEGDSRVDPLHARKMAARLQEASSCQDERPVLLREEGRAGHGQGKPVGKQADELADALGFLLWQVGGPAAPPGGAEGGDAGHG